LGKGIQMAKIIKDYPPNYERIKAVLNPPASAVFAYGDKIYVPSGATIGPDLLVHEGTHERQQALMGIEQWWNMYLGDKTFRLREEVEAYAAQYNYVDKRYRNSVAQRYLAAYAKHLSTLYGVDVNFFEAFTMIKKKAEEMLITKK
jgi:hypothetical protein